MEVCQTTLRKGSKHGERAIKAIKQETRKRGPYKVKS